MLSWQNWTSTYDHAFERVEVLSIPIIAMTHCGKNLFGGFLWFKYLLMGTNANHPPEWSMQVKRHDRSRHHFSNKLTPICTEYLPVLKLHFMYHRTKSQKQTSIASNLYSHTIPIPYPIWNILVYWKNLPLFRSNWGFLPCPVSLGSISAMTSSVEDSDTLAWREIATKVVWMANSEKLLCFTS